MKRWGTLVKVGGTLIASGVLALVGTSLGWQLSSSTSAATVPFAPYVDMTLPPVGNLGTLATQAGIKSATLAFIVAQGTSCSPSWGNYFPVGQNNGEFQSEIASFVANGGTPIISFGGEINNGLATVCPKATALANAYETVVNRYHVYSLDFDVEGSALDDTASVTLRNQALHLLQTTEAGEGHPITVSYTLPVLPTGLLSNSLSLLRSAVANDVKVSVVNVMAMDYGSANAPDTNAMGTYAIDAAKATEAQLGTIFTGLSQDQLWNMVGVTPMIGQNDLTGEIFTTQDAMQLADFAKSYDLGRLSYWELHRDVECANDADIDSNYCSGTTQTPYQFAQIFGAVPAQTPSNPQPTEPSPSSGSQAPAAKLTLTTSTSWEGGCTMSATVTNDSNEPIDSWSVGVNLGSGDSIVNIWNASQTESAGVATITNVSYNGSLAPGATTSFGFQVSGDCATVTPSSGTGSSTTGSSGTGSGGGTPSSPAVPGGSSGTNPVKLSEVVTSSWDGGYVVEATVTNDSNEPIDSWSVGVNLGSGDSIVNIWNASQTESAGVATITNVSYNGSLAPGATTSFGFQVSGDCATVTPSSGTGSSTTGSSGTGSGGGTPSSPAVPGGSSGTNPVKLSEVVTSSWDGGYVVEATVTNDSNEPIDSWSVGVNLGSGDS
ncbi:MAG: cellulose binding domain-containing protein, partial [Ferrimicrobium sp.]